MNSLDYCDRCGAHGKVRYVLENGTDLVFCGHHSREYSDRLFLIATEIESEELDLLPA
jgi:hypothetical protein